MTNFSIHNHKVQRKKAASQNYQSLDIDGNLNVKKANLNIQKYSLSHLLMANTTYMKQQKLKKGDKTAIDFDDELLIIAFNFDSKNYLLLV